MNRGCPFFVLFFGNQPRIPHRIALLIFAVSWRRIHPWVFVYLAVKHVLGGSQPSGSLAFEILLLFSGSFRILTH